MFTGEATLLALPCRYSTQTGAAGFSAGIAQANWAAPSSRGKSICRYGNGGRPVASVLPAWMTSRASWPMSHMTAAP